VITDVHIQLANFSDVTEIAEMSKTEIEYGLPWGWTPSRVSKAIIDPATNVAVAREQGVLVAFGIMKYQDEVAHLLLLAVRSSRRRAGLGSALLIWLEKVALIAGIGAIRLQARSDNAAARVFYRTHGYRETASVRGMYQGIVDGIRLEKKLNHLRPK